MKCTICGKEIKGYSNSGAPAVDGICCDECNSHVVVPFRVFLASKAKTALLVTSTELKLVSPKYKYFTLDELQKNVEGYIEVTREMIDDCITVVNEEGLLIRLEPNELAKKLFNVNYVGNVLVVPKGIFKKPEDDED